MTPRYLQGIARYEGTRIPAQYTSLAIRVAAAGLGAAVAGPLGGAIGGWLGAALDGPARKLITEYAGKFGEKAAEKLLDGGADSLIDRLKRPAPQIEEAYRNALLLSLADIQQESESIEFSDWFTNWNTSLKSPAPLNLKPIQPEQLAPEKLDSLFRLTMESLDAQGKAIRQKSTSLNLATRTMPEALLSILTAQLPDRLPANFRELIVQDAYEEAWKQQQLAFQDFAVSTLRSIDRKTDVLPQVADDAATAVKLLEGLTKAMAEGRIPSQQLSDKDAEIARLTAELKKLQESLAVREVGAGRSQALKTARCSTISPAPSN